MIELNEEDALSFKTYMEYKNIIDDLIRSGVFQIKNGCATIHFSPIGQLMKVETLVVNFRR